MVFAVRSERQASIATLIASNANIDGDQGITHGLPGGFGDLAILGIAVRIHNIATMVADPTILGVAVQLVDAGGTVPQDVLVTKGWEQVSASRLYVAYEFEVPIYMRESEQLVFNFSEVDTNATPTADFDGIIRVRRLRDLSHGERQLYLRGMLGT